MPTHIYIINHTHWDREWFLTSEYTSRWIPNLINKLEQLRGNNPSYHFLLDGQTLVIEDLLQLAPHMQNTVRELVKDGCLAIGPYYAQLDWQLATGELLIRNLQYGLHDAALFGQSQQVGWMVDTFGHINQAPQIHQLFDITALYVWRGVPQLEPYFTWQGADNSQILAINLLGGYRNLYGVAQVPEIASRRLFAEVERLSSFYPSSEIPLFDGYDLENNPEDPLDFYLRNLPGRPEFTLQEATPQSFAELISRRKPSLPKLQGELNSGKFGATFPGVFSARTYLKIMAHDCQNLLFRLCEPIVSLAHLCGQSYPAQLFERLGRLLLQNGVHDCICGVGIDQVHEKMTWIYHKVFDELLDTLQSSIMNIMRNFTPGEYAISTNPFTSESWLSFGGELLRMQTNGIGIWPIAEKIPIVEPPHELEENISFTWRNDYYEAVLQPDGLIRIGNALLGELRIYREDGDAYSDQRGDLLGIIYPTSQVQVKEKTERHAVLEFASIWKDEAGWVSAQIHLVFDSSPLVRWQIELDSSGTDLSIEMHFSTARQGEIWAGMPFDLVNREEADNDLLPKQPPLELTSILLGQRELGEVRTFPFHDLVAISDQQGSSVVFARGLHAYRAEKGALSITLRRSVEWLTRSDLQCRLGDAGPLLYVPDARCERNVIHELSFASLPYQATSMEIQALNSSFQTPPIVVRVDSHGSCDHWEFLQENVPLSSLQLQGSNLLAHFYNPTNTTASLSHTYVETDIHGHITGKTRAVPAKKIAVLKLDRLLPDGLDARSAIEAQIAILNLPQWHVGQNHGLPDLAALAVIGRKITSLEAQIGKVKSRLVLIQNTGEGDQDLRLRLEHRYFVLLREQLEYKLSLLLNERKLEYCGIVPLDALIKVDPEIEAIGKELNLARIKRRIYDYVVQALEDK
jgi:alpha-mannosidase